MRIYRLQHKTEKIGVFRFCGKNWWDHELAPIRERVDTAGEEIPTGACDDIPHSDEIAFGFPSKELVETIFGNLLIKDLEAYDIVLVSVDVPDNDVLFSRSGKQVAFPKSYL